MHQTPWTGLTLLIVAGMAALPGYAQTANSHLLDPGTLVQVSDHTWMIKGFPNIGIVVGTRATLVVDTGLGTPNGKIVSDVALRLSTKGQKLYLTTTHYHAEHAAGDGGFPPGTIVIRPRVQQIEMEAEGQKLMDLFSGRSAEDKELLQGVKIRPAGILFDKSYSLDLGGGVKVSLSWFGPAHTKGDELVMVEPDSVLYSGDVVQNKAGPYFYCAECTPGKWLTVLEQVAQLHPRIVVPDHSPPGDGALITSEQAFMRNLQARAGALKTDGKSEAEAERILTPEIEAKYQGWSGLNHIQDAVARAYAEAGAP